MPSFQRANLESHISRIAPKKCKLRSELERLNLQADTIVNFGCSVGIETLALMWFYDAHEAIGIDVDESSIFQANQDITILRQDLQESKQALSYVSAEDRTWWDNQVPGFLKELRFPAYLQGDVTQQTSLEPEHFNLAYCSNVLYLILESQGETGIERAIEEMARVTRVGGWIIASEPTTSEDELLAYRAIFGQVGLNPVELQPFRSLDGELPDSYLYTYQK